MDNFRDCRADTVLVPGRCVAIWNVHPEGIPRGSCPPWYVRTFKAQEYRDHRGRWGRDASWSIEAQNRGESYHDRNRRWIDRTDKAAYAYAFGLQGLDWSCWQLFRWQTSWPRRWRCKELVNEPAQGANWRVRRYDRRRIRTRNRSYNRQGPVRRRTFPSHDGQSLWWRHLGDPDW